MSHKRLKYFRTIANMTQKQIADALSYDRGHYSKIEAGISPMPSDFYWRAIHKMLQHVEHAAKVLQDESKMSHSSSDLSHYGN